MKTGSHKFFVPFLLLVAFLVSCAHCPRSQKVTESILKSRTEYIKEHPDGLYNDHILSGEVVKGMSLVEVLASWGLPNSRRHSESGSLEYWTYITEDQTEGVKLYELVFHDQSLIKWNVLLSSIEPGFHSREKSSTTSAEKERTADSQVLKK